MRGTVAKRLRREVYGDGSRRPARRLLATSANPTTAFNAPESPRAYYQALKDAHRSR